LSTSPTYQLNLKKQFYYLIDKNILRTILLRKMFREFNFKKHRYTKNYYLFKLIIFGIEHKNRKKLISISF